MWVGESYYPRFNFFIGASGCKGIPAILGFMLAIFLTVACQHDKNSKSRPGSEGVLIRGFARKGCVIRLPIFQKTISPYDTVKNTSAINAPTGCSVVAGGAEGLCGDKRGRGCGLQGGRRRLKIAADLTGRRSGCDRGFPGGLMAQALR